MPPIPLRRQPARPRRLAEETLEDVLIGEVHETVAVEVGMGIGRPEPRLEGVLIREVHEQISIEVRIAAVAEAVAVGIALVGIRMVDAVVEVVTHPVVIGIQRVCNQDRIK